LPSAPAYHSRKGVWTRIFSGIFGADFKILASLELQSGNARVEWGILILSIQHVPKLPYERRHRILLPSLEQTLKELEARRLEGVAPTFASEKLILNGPGEFARLDWRDRTAAAQRIRQVSTALQKAEQAEMGHHPDGIVR
jgi:hypothetical protein